MLAFAIPVLVHDPAFTNHEDRTQLKQVEKSLRFVLEPLMAKKDAFSYGFYKNIIEKMKNHQVSTPNAEDNSYNVKMWAACDLAMYIINTKIGIFDSNNNFSVNIQLPSMYFKPLSADFQNTNIYIPLDMYSSLPTATSKKVINSVLPTTSSTNRSAEKRAAESATLNENSPTNVQRRKSASFDDIKADLVSEPATKRTRSGIVRAGKP